MSWTGGDGGGAAREATGGIEVSDRIRILFLCVHNSARSRMAEGFLRRYGGDRFEVASSGAAPAAAVRPLAVKGMALHHIDLAAQRPKRQGPFAERAWDDVNTTCDESREVCPVFPGGPERIHWHFDDPSAAEGTEAEQERAYFRVAREIEVRVRLFVDLATRQAADRAAVPSVASAVEDAVREIMNGLDELAERP